MKGYWAWMAVLVGSAGVNVYLALTTGTWFNWWVGVLFPLVAIGYITYVDRKIKAYDAYRAHVRKGEGA